ncbi:MAG TPA: hypothetical protein VG895_04580 [Patescibacteria group bacterium]|nr:hypothetical protein [Patescibacteria group bacterium]
MKEFIFKYRKILILILGIFIVIIFVFIYLNSRGQNVSTDQNNFKAPTGVKVNVNNQTVNNFYKSDTFTYPTGNAVIDENPYYQIAYTSNNQEFLITILSSDPNSQNLAEQDFVSKLSISQSTACKLNVEVRSYSNLNITSSPNLSKLSFCK